MKKQFDMEEINRLVVKWQGILNLKEWHIKVIEVNQEWRKTGDVKIDDTDKKVILMINNYNPKQENVEALVIHELIHVKLWGMDQMIEELIEGVFGEDETDKRYQFAYNTFMKVLETTTEDLAQGYYSLSGNDEPMSFGRIQKQVDEELGK